VSRVNHRLWLPEPRAATTCVCWGGGDRSCVGGRTTGGGATCLVPGGGRT
jgi:hypothetical protein